MKLYSIVLSFCLLGLLVFSSCVKDGYVDKPKGKKVTISLKFKLFKKSLLDVNKAIMTMKKDGNPFVNKKIYDVSYSGGTYSIDVDLLDGNYVIEELVLGTSSLAVSGTYPNYKDAKYFAPKKTDTESLTVPKGKLLPYTFKVDGGKASATGSSLGSTGVGSGYVSLDLIPVSPPAPVYAGYSKIHLTWKDVFSYGFKTISDGKEIEDCIIKINRVGYAKDLFYGISDLKYGKKPYFIFAKDPFKYDFEISKFGYASRKAKQLDAGDANNYNKSEKIALRELHGNGDIYIKPATTGGSADDNIQRGGGDFASLYYWDHLPNKKAGVAGFFNINQAELINDTAKISSKYQISTGDYKLKLSVYGNPSANTIFVIKLGDKTKYYKKYTPASGVTPDGSSIANAYELPATASNKEIDFGLVSGGKVSFGVYPSAEKSKISFQVEQLKSYTEPKITKWTGGWRDDDAFTATITGYKIDLDVNSADFINKVTLNSGTTISPDPNTITDWRNEVSFEVKNGALTKTYKVKVKVNGRDIIKAVGTPSQLIYMMEDEYAKYGYAADFNHIDVSSVTDFFGVFSNLRFNGDISKWDVSNVTNMYAIFSAAYSFNGDISGWDVSNVTNMKWMFAKTKVFNQDISGWDVSNVTDIEYMFYNAEAFNQDISGWKVDNVTNMSGMFREAEVFNQDISGWKVDNVTNMRGMFRGTKVFNQDISRWDVSNVTDMTFMFGMAKAFNQDIGGWDVSNVTYMVRMFKGAKVFNQDISGWNVSNVENMGEMFMDAEAFNQDLSDWKSPKTDNVTRCRGFSTGARAWTRAKPTFNNCRD